MAWITRTVTLTLVLLALTPTAASAGALVVPHTSHGPCVFVDDPKPKMGSARVEHLVHAMYACAQRRFPVPRGFSWLDCTGDRESGDWPWASNGGRYLGLFQHAASAWDGRARAYLPAFWFPGPGTPGAFNARANALVTARMVRAGGTGPWAGGCG